jgi:hypothetical protein
VKLAAAAAAIGGLLWGIKAVSILVADVQPAYTFEVAPFFFGLAGLGLVTRYERLRTSPARAVCSFAWLAVSAGLAAALLHFLFGDVAAFGLAIMTALIALLVVLFWTGRRLREWSPVPWILGWTIVASLPIGGALAEIDERLLEVPLLIVSAFWILLAAALYPAPSRVQLTA